jgi:hypothetical protein
VVLDDDHGLPGVDEPVKQAEELLDVSEVKAGRWLIEDVDPALLGSTNARMWGCIPSLSLASIDF